MILILSISINTVDKKKISIQHTDQIIMKTKRSIRLYLSFFINVTLVYQPSKFLLIILPNFQIFPFKNRKELRNLKFVLVPKMFYLTKVVFLKN